MVKLSQIEYKKPAVFRRAWGLKYTQRGDFKGAAPRHFLVFVRLQGARK